MFARNWRAERSRSKTVLVLVFSFDEEAKEARILNCEVVLFLRTQMKVLEADNRKKTHQPQAGEKYTRPNTRESTPSTGSQKPHSRKTIPPAQSRMKRQTVHMPPLLMSGITGSLTPTARNKRLVMSLCPRKAGPCKMNNNHLWTQPILPKGCSSNSSRPLHLLLHRCHHHPEVKPPTHLQMKKVLP